MTSDKSHTRTLAASPASLGASKHQALALAAVLLFSLVLQLTFLVGITDADSSWYAEVSMLMAKGTFGFTSPSLYQTRPLLIYPTALSFRYFGVNELTAAGYTMLTSLIVLILTYLVGRHLYSARVGVLAALLLSVCPVYLVTSATLLPDVPLAMCLTASAYLFLIARASRSRWRWSLFLASGLAVGAGWLVKEMAVLLFVFYGAFFIFYRREVSKAYWLIFVAAAMVFLLETAAYAWLTGNPLFRLDALRQSTSWGGATDDWCLSLWAYPYDMFVSFNEFGLLFHLLVAALVYAMVRKKRQLAIPALWFLTMFLYLEFGTWSITGWRIGFHNARYVIPALVPACLVVAFWLGDSVYLLRRSACYAVVGSVVLSSFAFTSITYALDLQSRNGPKWACNWLKGHDGLPVYTGAYNMAPIMRFYCAGSQCERVGIRSRVAGPGLPPTHSDYYQGAHVDLSEVPECYVVTDELSNATDWLRAPNQAEIGSPPPNWHLVASEQVTTPGVAGLFLECVDWGLSLPIRPEGLFKNQVRAVHRIASGSRVEIYDVQSSSIVSSNLPTVVEDGSGQNKKERRDDKP